MKTYRKVWTMIFVVLACLITSCEVREIDGGYQVGLKRPGQETEKPQEKRTSPKDSTPTPTPSPTPVQEEQLTVTLDLNKKEAYQLGEKMVITVRANQDCYLMLFDVSSNGHVAQMSASNRFLQQGRPYRIPDQTDSFDLEVTEPLGVSQLQAICTKNKITTLKKTYSNSEQFEQSVSQLVSTLPSSEWAKVKLEYMVGQETRTTEIAQSRETPAREKQQHVPTTDPHWIADQNGCKVYNPNPQPNETITWSGECINGIANEFGELRWYKDGKENGYFQGEMKEGKYHGIGIIIYPDGKYYKGEWKYGERDNVIGISTFKEFVKNIYFGSKYWDAIYVGEWENNQPNGCGYKRWGENIFRDDGKYSDEIGIFRDWEYQTYREECNKYKNIVAFEKRFDQAIQNSWCKSRNTIILSSVAESEKSAQKESAFQEIGEKCPYLADYVLAKKIGSEEAKQRYVEKWIQHEPAGLLIDSLAMSEFQNIMQTRSLADAKAFLARYPYTTYKPKLEQLITEIEQALAEKKHEEQLALQQQKYDEIVRTRSLNDAKAFLSNYPNEFDSPYTSKIKQLIETLEMEMQQQQYVQAKQANTVESYAAFIKPYCSIDCSSSTSQYVREADTWLTTYFAARRNELKTNGSVEAYNAFLKNYHADRYALEILREYNALADQAYAEVKFYDEEQRYDQFVKTYPYAEAIKQLKEEQAFKSTKKVDTIESYNSFLRAYPNSQFVPEVQSRLKELETLQKTQTAEQQRKDAERERQEEKQREKEAEQRRQASYWERKSVGQRVCMEGTAGFYNAVVTAFVEAVSGDQIQLRIAGADAVTTPLYKGVYLNANTVIWDHYSNWGNCQR